MFQDLGLYQYCFLPFYTQCIPKTLQKLVKDIIKMHKAFMYKIIAFSIVTFSVGGSSSCKFVVISSESCLAMSFTKLLGSRGWYEVATRWVSLVFCFLFFAFFFCHLYQRDFELILAHKRFHIFFLFLFLYFCFFFPLYSFL